MKICDITQAYSAQSGGIRTYIEAKRKFINDHTDGEHVLIIPGEEDRIETEGRLKTYYISAPALPGYKTYRFILRIDRVLSVLKTEQPDIIELGSGYVLPWAVFKYRKYHRCGVIGFYHTDFPDAYIKTPITRKIHPWFGNYLESPAYRYVKTIYGNCDHTIVSSRNLKNKLESFGIENTRLLPLGVDFEVFAGAVPNQRLRNQFSGDNNRIILIYAGRFDSEKRPDFLIEAFRNLPQKENYSLVLIGEGPLQSTILKESTSENNIFVLPYIREKRKLAEILATADIYVTAGAHETFGLSVLEAQAAGLPVVGVESGALVDRVSPEFGSLAHVHSPSDMALHIYRLSQNGKIQKGKSAQSFVKKHHTWESIFEKLFNLYHNTLENAFHED